MVIVHPLVYAAYDDPMLATVMTANQAIAAVHCNDVTLRSIVSPILFQDLIYLTPRTGIRPTNIAEMTLRLDIVPAIFSSTPASMEISGIAEKI